MDEQEIRMLIRQEMISGAGRSAFGVGFPAFHTHNSSDSPGLSYLFTFDHSLIGTSAATAGNYGVFFIARQQLTIQDITEVHSTAGSDGSAVTLQVELLTGTTASGSGSSILTSGFNLKGTANTLQTGTILGSRNQLAVGDRLGLVLTGTPTAVNTVVVSILFRT